MPKEAHGWPSCVFCSYCVMPAQSVCVPVNDLEYSVNMLAASLKAAASKCSQAYCVHSVKMPGIADTHCMHCTPETAVSVVSKSSGCTVGTTDRLHTIGLCAVTLQTPGEVVCCGQRIRLIKSSCITRFLRQTCMPKMNTHHIRIRNALGMLPVNLLPE